MNHWQSPEAKTTFKLQSQKSLQTALAHLQYSYEKVSKMDLKKASWDDEQLETLESFSSRFARASDLFVARYLRLLIQEKDPAFRGSLIDLLNLGEKLGLLEYASKWIRIRELRNVAAHEYAAEDLQALYQEVFDLTPFVLAAQKLL